MKRYYVDAVEEGGIVFLAGPFPDEISARRRECEVASFAIKHGHMSPFSDWGVSSIDGGYSAPGKLNEYFEFAEGELLNQTRKRSGYRHLKAGAHSGEGRPYRRHANGPGRAPRS